MVYADISVCWKLVGLVGLKMPGDVQKNPVEKIPALSRQRLGDQIADVLRKQILLGELRPGSNIPERETASALGVSRTPLREALLILEVEGLVIMAPARSPIVANPSLEDLTQLLLVQSALEALAGECACEKITNDEFDHVESLHLHMLASSDISDDSLDFFSTDMAFHEAIVASTKNPPLIKTHRQYNARLWRARFMSSRRKIKRASTLRDHTNIVEGLKKRDKAQTSAALGEHLRIAITNIAGIFAREENPE